MSVSVAQTPSTGASSAPVIPACIVCQQPRVEEFLDLGVTALANNFLTPEEIQGDEPAYPLRVGFCHNCGHVQLTTPVPPARMFQTYLYKSSASTTLIDHMADLAGTLVERHRLGPDDLVVDIGCNDGTLLLAFRDLGVRTLGVDPAENLAALDESGIDRYVGFFGERTADEITKRWGRAAVATATNTFPHIPALDDFVRGIDRLLEPGGTFVIEAHYLLDLIEQGAFDTVYHEHISYWALGPLIRLFDRFELDVVRVERLPIHHGQIRASVQRRGEGDIDSSVHELLDLERSKGLDRFSTMEQFGQQVRRAKDDLQSELRRLKSEGKRLAAYGAPAKGNTLLSYLELDADTIEYIADRSSLKHGRFTPGTHIPVVPAERLLEDQPDYAVLLAWNFEEEILAQQAEYRRRGGKFLIPVPELREV
jgi:SAM-dependent methyltransferase